MSTITIQKATAVPMSYRSLNKLLFNGFMWIAGFMAQEYTSKMIEKTLLTIKMKAHQGFGGKSTQFMLDQFEFFWRIDP